MSGQFSDLSVYGFDGVFETQGVWDGSCNVLTWFCQAFLKYGGRFTLSDDSHGVEHVGSNYEKMLEFIEKTGIEEIHFLERGGAGFDHRFPNVSMSSVSLADLKRHAFWRAKGSK